MYLLIITFQNGISTFNLVKFFGATIAILWLFIVEQSLQPINQTKHNPTLTKLWRTAKYKNSC